ncbi:scaffolding protein [Mycobacterium phage Rose5]|nr:scaffolding protein [Mycobacterium phage Rose5]
MSDLNNDTEDVTTPDSAADSGGDSGGGDTGFKPITSQEDFEKALSRRIARERNKYKDYDDLKAKAAEFEKLQAEKGSDIEKLTRRAEKAERELASLTEKLSKAERMEMVRDLADEMGLPKKLIKRVQGDSEEDIRADIEDLLDGLPKPEKKAEADGGDKDKEKKPPTQAPKARMTFTATGDEADEGLELTADEILKDVPRGGV